MRVGVIGGGQLGQMLALAVRPLGIETICLDPAADCAASLVTHTVEADFHDLDAIETLAEEVDVLTYEFENIDPHILADIGTVQPCVEALIAAQHRGQEKKFFHALDIPTADYEVVTSEEKLTAALASRALPVILKTCKMGYDGKGQVHLEDVALASEAWKCLDAKEILIEEKIKFDRELSLIAVRSLNGDTIFYPLIENQHQAGILHFSHVPALDAQLQAQAQAYATKILDKLAYVGVLTIEFFQVKGELIANEMAPRVHNSGHWTIEGASASQFENHMRAILGLPLNATHARGHSVMANVIGSAPPLKEILTIFPEAHCHFYGKKPRPDRKIGHVTAVYDTPQACHQFIQLWQKSFP